MNRRLGRQIVAVGGIAIAAMMVGLVGGCMPIWEGRELESELQEMRERQAELEDQGQQREEELAKMIGDAQSEIDELEEVLDEAEKLLRRDSAQLGADVRQMREDLGRMRGRLEELEFEFRRFDETFVQFREDMDQRFAGVEPEELLEQAQEFQDQDEYHLARRALERFLSEHGDHQLVGEARLELGEVYYETEMWQSAIEVFRDVRDDAGSSARQARATRRIGDVFMQLGNCDNAELFFESVVLDYPDSRDAQPAQDQLDAIERGECPP